MERAKRYTYSAIFTREADGSYSVRWPQLDGCYTQGKSFEEAYRMAVDAMSLHLYGMEQDGEAIPAPQMEQQTGAGETLVAVTAWQADENLKRQGESLFDGDPFYGPQNMERLSRAIQDLEAGRNCAEHELLDE